MPGAYAHLTLVAVLTDKERLAGLGLHDDIQHALTRWFSYCELGALSPDYPYLARKYILFADKKAQRWADEFHLTQTLDVIRIGSQKLKTLSGEQREKATAWLFGYMAHVGMDVTVHPVIELIAGPYHESKDNQSKHRLCEMHQDLYIWKKYKPELEDIGVYGHFNEGIAKCLNVSDKRLDNSVKHFWMDILKEVYPDEFRRNPPHIDKWHRHFLTIISKLEKSALKGLFPIARHVGKIRGLTYPLKPDIQYLENLQAPDGRLLHYDAIFDHAVQNVGQLWKHTSDHLHQDCQKLSELGNWSLDEGTYLESSKKEQYVFWS
jgi:hypothetical protein